MCSLRDSTGRKELEIEYKKCPQIRNGKIERILPRGENDQKNQRGPSSFLAPEAKVEVRKNYREVTINLEFGEGHFRIPISSLFTPCPSNTQKLTGRFGDKGTWEPTIPYPCVFLAKI